MIGFHTPRLPAPLNLDLAELRGGGSCPSQFYGKTHDGMDVYVRYRGGTLSVHVATEHGADAYREGECLLKVDIGPELDGSISLTQFCTGFGVTVNGSVPSETDKNAHYYRDLTGKTTFWNAQLPRVTDQTSRKIVEAVCETFPDGLLVTPIFDKKFKIERLELTTPKDIKNAFVWLVNGPAKLAEIETTPEGSIIAKSGQLLISLSFTTWQYPNPVYTTGGPRGLEPIAEQIGQPVFVAGDRNTPTEFALAHHQMSLGAKFPQGDSLSRAALERLGHSIMALLPETTLERIDLAKGETLSVFDDRLDPVIKEWCLGGPNRWLFVQREEMNGPWIAIRPQRN